MVAFNFADEKRRFDAEVDEEAARLVQMGTMPYEALPRAAKIVSARRARKAAPDFNFEKPPRLPRR